MKSLPYHEGSFFALPLRNGGYAVGVVARMAPEGKMLLTYLFGKKFVEIPSLADVATWRSTDAIKCLRIGDLGLLNGEWPVLGEAHDWKRADWPMPSFLRREDFSKRAWRVTFDEADPSHIAREELVPHDLSGLESAGSFGYGAVELLLTKLLSS